MERKFKVADDGALYCAPRHLVGTVANQRVRAGTLRTIVASSHHHVITPPIARFAIVWIKRRRTEYVVRLCRYSEIF